ncbi:MAG: hypothetical protein U1F87_10880 [Kiritimatiellia bacterium]
MREGDELRVIGRVHNLTDHKGPVALSRLLDAADPRRSSPNGRRPSTWRRNPARRRCSTP